MPEKETLEEYKKRVSSSGGKAVVAKYGTKRMGKLGKKGMKSRWGKTKKKGLKDLLFDH